MKYFIPLILLSLSVHAQNSSPKLDPDKFTICAITINTDTEKKIFQANAAKHPGKFNPVVELTTMGTTENWFQKACESKIKCDQLVISGHFAGEFFSHDNELRLPIEDIEKAGCSKSCEGILGQPYEVFLFGCNTLAEKDADSRTPAQYLQVLLQDGIPRAQAELVVQSRYGNIGDSNRASMQRAFGGEKKHLYGFDSIGPSGQTVKKFLNDYFSKINPVARLEKLAAKRMMNQIDEGNALLAKSLNPTSFAQCESADLNDEKTKKICALLDSRKSKDEKLALTLELMTQTDALLYLPAINSFMKSEDTNSYTPEQKALLQQLTDNQVIKKQLLGLIEKTNGLGVKVDWSNLANKLGYLTKDEKDAILRKEVQKIFEKPLKAEDAQAICDFDQGYELAISDSDMKNKKVGDNEIYAYTCLSIRDEAVLKRAMQYNPGNNKDALKMQRYRASNLPEGMKPPHHIYLELKRELNNKEEMMGAFMDLSRFYPKDPDVIKKAKQIVNDPTADKFLVDMAQALLNPN